MERTNQIRVNQKVGENAGTGQTINSGHNGISRKSFLWDPQGKQHIVSPKNMWIIDFDTDINNMMKT